MSLLLYLLATDLQSTYSLPRTAPALSLVAAWWYQWWIPTILASGISSLAITKRSTTSLNESALERHLE